MNRKWLMLAVALIAGIAVLLFLSNRAMPRRAEASTNAPDGVSGVGNAAGTVPGRLPGRVISETLTSTGRVYLVTRGGQTNTTIIPNTVRLSPEELQQVLFPDEAQAPVAPQRGLGMNPLLVFYGVAVDENTNSVAGAKIEANVMVDLPDAPSHREIITTNASGDGRFELQIPWGQQMMITVTHTTNYISPPSQWFQFGPVGDRPIHVPDSNNPVVFSFQTRKPAENLFRFSSRYRAKPDGTPVRIDLTTGQIVAQGGDLIVSLRCPEPYTELKNFKWSGKVEVVDGGILSVGNGSDGSRLELLHEAPVHGYSPSFSVNYGPDSPDYRRQHEGLYYVRSGNGRIFAKLRLDLNPFWDDRGVPFGISAIVNTNGSRYLHSE